MYRFLSLFFILFFSCRAHAQFKGLDSFRWDTLWQRILHQAGVKCVKEFIAGKTDYNTGRCIFDKTGRLVGSFLVYNGSYWKSTYAYNKKDQVIEVVSYDHKDTTKVISREEHKLDKSGKTSYTITNNFVEGKWIPDSSETKILCKSKTLTVKESTHKKAGKIYRTVYEKDSLDGLCKFITNTTIEYNTSPPGDSRYEKWDSITKTERLETEVEAAVPENYISRNILWHCAPKNIKYSVEIKSHTFDGQESIYGVKTNYVKYDDKNRFIEIGEINYSEFSPQRSGISPAEISKDLIKKIVDGTLKGRELLKLQFIYKDDLLVEENIVGTKKQYTYNRQRQLIKTTELKGVNEICLYEYNEKGLITEINCTSAYNGNQTSSKTTKYLYEYH